MTHEQIKDYLKKYRIDSEEQLAKHIEELKRNTISNNEIIFPLVDMLVNEKAVLNSFFAENKKQEMFTRTVTPFFLDERLGKCSTQCFCDGSCKKPKEKKLGGYKIPNVKVNSTRHKAREEGRYHPYPLTPEKDDVITNSSRGEKETIQGIKENEGKLNYELDWEFIQQMAERMSQNKGKYEPYNWKRPMEVEKLKQSLFRHVVEVMKGNYSDDRRDFGHFESIALNSMMINYQLKVK